MDDKYNIYCCKKCGEKNAKLLDFVYKNNKASVYCTPCFKPPVDYYVYEKLAAQKKQQELEAAEKKKQEEAEAWQQHTDSEEYAYTTPWEPFYNHD